MGYYVCQISGKTNNFDFFDPKMNVEVGISKMSVQIPNQHLYDTMCAIFQ